MCSLLPSCFRRSVLAGLASVFCTRPSSFDMRTVSDVILVAAAADRGLRKEHGDGSARRRVRFRFSRWRLDRGLSPLDSRRWKSLPRTGPARLRVRGRLECAVQHPRPVLARWPLGCHLAASASLRRFRLRVPHAVDPGSGMSLCCPGHPDRRRHSIFVGRNRLSLWLRDVRLHPTGLEESASASDASYAWLCSAPGPGCPEDRHPHWQRVLGRSGGHLL